MDAEPSLSAALDTCRVELEATRACAWCKRPIPAGKRRDTVTCGKPCRQARHRFTVTIGTPQLSRGDRAQQARHFAYADPPYPGLAGYYREHIDFAGEVDHIELIARLASYDGWALSTSARALPDVLPLCPPGTRVAAWVRGERPTSSYRALSSWEPVLYHGDRRITSQLSEPGRPRRVDSLVHGVAPYTTMPTRIMGQKPAAFCRWIFDLLGAQPGDQLDDLYPGSGAISRAWATYTQGDPA